MRGLSQTTPRRLLQLDGAGNRQANSSLLRQSSSQSRRCRPRPAAAFDSDPLAALDKAAALLNRALIFSTEKDKKEKKNSNKPTKKRWVSFSASATSAVAVAPLLEAAAAGLRRRSEQVAARQRTAAAAAAAEAGSVGAEEEEQEQQELEQQELEDGRRGERIPGRDLLAYLALPASEYSLLDPAWVTREGELEELEVEEEGGEEEGGEGDSASTSSTSCSSSSSLDEGGQEREENESFIVRFPLSDLVGLPLTPSFRVRVSSRGSSPSDGIVAFSADRAALGDPALDSAFEAGVDATLSKKKNKKKGKKLGGLHLGSSKKELEEQGEEEQGREPSSALFASEDDTLSSLQAHVTIKARVQLSGAAASLPAPLVSLAAKLVCRAALAATLNPFLSLLVGDYCAWSLGLDRGALLTLGDVDKQQLRQQVAQATAEMEEEMERRKKKKEAEAEEAARGEGEVIEL